MKKLHGARSGTWKSFTGWRLETRWWAAWDNWQCWRKGLVKWARTSKLLIVDGCCLLNLVCEREQFALKLVEIKLALIAIFFRRNDHALLLSWWVSPCLYWPFVRLLEARSRGSLSGPLRHGRIPTGEAKIAHRRHKGRGAGESRPTFKTTKCILANNRDRVYSSRGEIQEKARIDDLDLQTQIWDEHSRTGERRPVG
jgi:hypothetical protein